MVRGNLGAGYNDVSPRCNCGADRCSNSRTRSNAGLIKISGTVSGCVLGGLVIRPSASETSESLEYNGSGDEVSMSIDP